MKYLFKNIRWLRVISTALITFALSYLSLILVTTVYAFILAFQVRGKPDQFAIGQFAESVSKWLMPLFEIVFTFISTIFTSKKIENNLPINGLVIGVLVGILGIIFKLFYGGMVNIYWIILFLIICVSGYLGGLLVEKRRNRKLRSPA
jgi:RsiW-degrading membrane proteinase PrsW (M82 family)